MERYVTLPQVCENLQTSRQSIWRWVREGTFPAPVKLGERKVAWRESDLRRWETSRQAVTYAPGEG